MVKLIIRDDDANFFTNPMDLENVYQRINDFPISFAVVPYVADVLGGCPETKGNHTERFVGENEALTDYLYEKYHSGRCDILMHGISHQYQFRNDVKIPEMQWRDNQEDLTELIAYWRKKMITLFDAPIDCFVAPSNRIMKNGINAVYSNGMNYSGIIPISFDRDLSCKSVHNWIKRCAIRIVKKLPYPAILEYGTHQELNACNTTNYDYLYRMYNYCKQIKAPMAINVHYWHMRDYPDQYDGFFRFIDYALQNGAVPAKLSDCFKK